MRVSALLPFAFFALASLSAAGCVQGADDTGEAEEADGTEAAASAADPCAFAHSTTVDVKSAAELTSALSKAAPGAMIRLAAGTYSGHFGATKSGTAAEPIILCGPRTAILNGGSTSKGYGFHLEADFWTLSGFTVTKSQKGIVLDGAHHDLLRGLLVHEIGQEGVHFRTFSTDNTLEASEVHHTGKVSAGFGEGVYIGSAESNWADVTGSSSKPDQSDNNKVLNNKLGPAITAEHIDIKEGTTGAEIRGNTFNGAGISGANSADSWVDVKGNSSLIVENTGSDTPKDGFQTHVRVDGWGNNNVFQKNAASVPGSGFGISIDAKSSGNVVACDNTVSGGSAKLSNVTCKN